MIKEWSSYTEILRNSSDKKLQDPKFRFHIYVRKWKKRAFIIRTQFRSKLLKFIENTDLGNFGVFQCSWSCSFVQLNYLEYYFIIKFLRKVKIASVILCSLCLVHCYATSYMMHFFTPVCPLALVLFAIRTKYMLFCFF